MPAVKSTFDPISGYFASFAGFDSFEFNPPLWGQSMVLPNDGVLPFAAGLVMDFFVVPAAEMYYIEPPGKHPGMIVSTEDFKRWFRVIVEQRNIVLDE